jgi:DNA-binding response OmpR family regulator
MNRIALIEDHERMAQLICKAFAAAGIEVEVFANLAMARAALELLSYSALIVDRGLPDGDGMEFVRRLRAERNLTPCLILTARDALHDRIDGLESGADDYLSKPFSMEELVARGKALLRRPAAMASLTPQHEDVKLLPELRSMTCGDETISLAPAELQIMLSLVRAEGRPVRRTALELAGWGLGEPVTPNALDVALHRLRKKLAAIGSRLQIVNIRGHGYALQEEGDAA